MKYEVGSSKTMHTNQSCSCPARSTQIFYTLATFVALWEAISELQISNQTSDAQVEGLVIATGIIAFPQLTKNRLSIAKGLTELFGSRSIFSLSA